MGPDRTPRKVIPSRPVNRWLFWILLLVPPAFVSVILIKDFREVYAEGAEFKHHLMGFVVLGQAFQYCILSALFVVPWVAINAVCFLRFTRSQRYMLGTSLCSVALGFLLLIVVTGTVYRAGRQTLYDSINFTQIGNDTGALVSRLSPTLGSAETIWFDEFDKSYRLLPASVIALKTRSLYINRGMTLLWLDGGGPASHEGVVFFANPNDPGIARGKSKCFVWQPITTAPGWFRFAAYDHRVLLDDAHAPGPSILKLLSPPPTTANVTTQPSN